MRLPSLTGLRAFEATGRLLSMKVAADELCVSPSAVSQTIRSLEAELRCDLFERRGRQLALSDAGQALLPALRDGFGLIAETIERLESRSMGGSLRIGATAFFAESWLIPRLRTFTEVHPNVDVSISTDATIASLIAGRIDVAIRHGLDNTVGMQSFALMTPPVTPVAAPALIASRGMPECAASLLDWPLLHSTDREIWSIWFKLQDVRNAERLPGSTFDDPGFLRVAALSGQGVALMPEPMVAPLVRLGDLVQLGAPSTIERLSYRLLIPDAIAARPRIQSFRSWITNTGTGDPVRTVDGESSSRRV